MRKSTLLLICLSPLVFGSCSKSSAPASAPPSSSVAAATSATSPGSDSSNAASATITTSQGKVPVCDLLTSKDLQPVQGEALKETKPSVRFEGGFLISQCFYSLPTFSNSISLLVSQRGETAGARDPKDFWKETFGRADEEEREKARQKESEREKDKAKEKDKDKSKEQPAAREEREEDEPGAPPLKISGIGDDAYWTGNRVGGALYVLQGNTYFRISVGGAGDQQTKIKRATALAQIILKRL